MFDRDSESTDPRRSERRLERRRDFDRESPVTGSSMLLKENTFISENERYIKRVDNLSREMGLFRESIQETKTAEVDEGVVDTLVGKMASNRWKVSVSNFREGIVSPIRDFLEERGRSTHEDLNRRHKQTILYLAQVRDTIERSGRNSVKGVSDTLRETMYNMTKSLASAVATVAVPVIKGIGTILFGTGKKEKSPTKAIEEQTLFLRTGKIIDNSSLLGRFFRRGLIPSAIAGGAALLGVGRSTAQRAEDKLSRGEELTGRERFVRSLIKWGIFTDITKRDLTGKGNVGAETNNLLKSILDTSKEYLTVTKQALMISMAFNKDFAKYFARGSEQTSNIMEDIRYQMAQMMRPILSPFESSMISLTKDQYYEIKRHREAKELELERDKRKKGKDDAGDGSGLFGFILPVFKKIGTFANLYLLKPILGAFLAAKTFILRGGIGRSIISPLLTAIRVSAPRLIAGFVARFNPLGMLVTAAITGFQIGKFIEPFVRKAFDWILRPLGVDFVDVVGGTIHRVVEFVKSSGRWIAGVFSSTIDAVAGAFKSVGGLLKDYLVKPVFGAFHAVGSAILGGITTAVKWVAKGIGKAMWGIFTWIGKQVIKIGWSVLSGIGNTLGSAIGWIGQKLVDAMVGTLKWAWGKISDGMGSLVSWIGNKIKEKVQSVPVIGRLFDWSEDSEARKFVGKVNELFRRGEKEPEERVTQRKEGERAVEDERLGFFTRVSQEISEKLRRNEEEVIEAREIQVEQNNRIIALLSNVVGNTSATVGALFDTQAAAIDANRKDALLDSSVGDF